MRGPEGGKLTIYLDCGMPTLLALTVIPVCLPTYSSVPLLMVRIHQYSSLSPAP